MTVATSSVLSQQTLDRFAERAPNYDRENRFFHEDFEELRQSGYLLMAVPEQFGGLGMSLAEVCREQRRLAYYAAPTALGVNMHLYWTGLFADAWRAGDPSMEPFLREAGAGEVFAAGHAESGNDLPVLLSTSNAERVDGGYRISGRKAFGSLTPVWTRLGLHAMDRSDPATPKIVHAFMPRETAGSSIVETWDVLGMRATKSDDTILDDVFIPDRYVARVVPAGAAGMDYFVLCMFAWGLMGFAHVYYGLAQRAADLVIENLKGRKSIGLSRSLSHHAEVQHGVAEMLLELEGIGPHLDQLAQDWVEHVDYGPAWGIKIVAAKYPAVESGWRVVDQALELAGGFGIFKRGPFERLWRDARLGRLHPANTMLTHELVAKTALGISLDEQPRWG
jgi:alkylation response protein AidB-like acyl-CoA dehydrogenase